MAPTQREPFAQISPVGALGRGHAGAHTARGQRYHDPHWAGTGFDEAAHAGLAFAIKPGERC